jgi:hypothetical protein
MGTHAEDAESWFLLWLRLGLLLLLAAPVVLSQNNSAFTAPLHHTSSPGTITLRNTAPTARNILSITLSGPQSGDFQQTNTCGTTLGAGADCTIIVMFSPQGVGPRMAVLQITDSASNSPQIINLSGTGGSPPSIGLVVSSGGSSSATVTAGQTASYTLSLGGAGMSGTANLTCSGAPLDAVCTIPASETISASTALSFKVTVSTSPRTAGTLRVPSLTPAPWAWATLLMASVVLPYRRIRSSAGKRLIRHMPLLLLLLLFLGSCGGGGSSSTSPPPSALSSGTPAGTYSLKVTATSGSASQSMSLSLTVQ